MPTVMIVLNIVLAALFVGAGIAHFLHGIATQHRYHGVEASGPLLRRKVWSRRARPHAGPMRPWIARRGETWPAA